MENYLSTPVLTLTIIVQAINFIVLLLIVYSAYKFLIKSNDGHSVNVILFYITSTLDITAKLVSLTALTLLNKAPDSYQYLKMLREAVLISAMSMIMIGV